MFTRGIGIVGLYIFGGGAKGAKGNLNEKEIRDGEIDK